MPKKILLPLLALGLALPATVFAQPAPAEEQPPADEQPPEAETTTTTTTTTTETETVTTTTETTAAPAPRPAAAPALTDRVADAPTEDVMTGALSAGGVLNTGNTSAATFSAGGNFRVVRGRNAFEIESTFNLGAADATPDDGNRNYDLNARNWNSRARYDRFFTDNDAAYLSSRHRWDTFAGLDTRAQFQLGYLRNFYKVENHRFWGEVGFDLTWDNVHNVNDDRDTTVAGRVFLGYQNHLNEHVEWLANVEVLPSFMDAQDVRINADTTLRVAVATRLQLELQFKMQYDNVPVVLTQAMGADPAIVAQKLDTQTTIRLVYNLF
jgi:putative salt-induced outer membrane protein YdiY